MESTSADQCIITEGKLVQILFSSILQVTSPEGTVVTRPEPRCQGNLNFKHGEDNGYQGRSTTFFSGPRGAPWCQCNPRYKADWQHRRQCIHVIIQSSPSLQKPPQLPRQSVSILLPRTDSLLPQIHRYSQTWPHQIIIAKMCGVSRQVVCSVQLSPPRGSLGYWQRWSDCDVTCPGTIWRRSPRCNPTQWLQAIINMAENPHGLNSCNMYTEISACYKKIQKLFDQYSYCYSGQPKFRTVMY